MFIKNAFVGVVTSIYNSWRYSIDTLVYIVIVVTSAALMVLNTALSLLILFEELVVACLILPWIPLNRIGDIVHYLRKWGLPVKLPLSLYIFIIVVFVTLSIIGLELHYLQVNESLLGNFDEFKSSLFTVMKLFVVIHRFVYLLSNESSLRRTCKLLKKRLKFEQNEELDEVSLAEGLEDDLEVEKLRFELDQARAELDALRLSHARLQREREHQPGWRP